MTTSRQLIRPLIRLDIALLIAVMLLAFAARVIPGARTIDDAFITFRYSRNIVEGQGFVYNPGLQSLGTTTPLYTLLMAAISFVLRGEDFQSYAIVVNALADAGTAALLFLLARRLTGNRWIGLLLGALWAVAPRSVTFAVGGMETSVNILWMVGAVWLYVIERTAWIDILIGMFAALGFLTRIDAVIWIGPLFAFQLGERWLNTRDKTLPQRVPWRTWIAFGVVLLPWLIFSQVYFGSVIPNSLTAKTKAYLVPPGSALVQFIQVYSTPFFEFDSFGSRGAAIGSLAYLVLSIIGILYAARRLPRVLPFLLYPWLYATLFSIADPLIFRWYTTPPLPAYTLGIVTGGWSLIEAAQHTLRQQPANRAVMPTALTALALLWGGMSLHAWDIHPDHGPDRPAPNMAWHKIELLYQQLGTELRDKYGVTPQTRVASADIGAIGYFSRATIIDTVGLVTPAQAKYYPVSPEIIVHTPTEPENYAIPPQLILDTQPEYFVTMEAFVRLGLEQNATFKAQYGDPIEKIPTGFYGTDMRLYRRQTQG